MQWPAVVGFCLTGYVEGKVVFERIWHMLIKEFIQVLRDPKMRGIIFIMPAIQTLIFGYVVTTDVRHVTTGVYDLDNSVSSRELVARFVRSGYFDVTAHIENDRELTDLVDHGRIQAALRINRGFENEMLAGRTAALQLIVDGSDSNTARIVMDYSLRITRTWSQQLLIERLSRLQGRYQELPTVNLQTRTWFNENLESRNYYVPGVIAIIITLVTLMLTSMAVVREKEIGTMEQIIVTPIRPVEFILGKTLPFTLIALVDVVVVTAVAVYWFDVPIRGSLLLLLGAAVVYLMTALGTGLIISTLSNTQQQAMMSTFFFFFPATLLSGFMFPIANMPVAVQYLTLLNPMRHVLVILRGLFLKGVGIEVLWPQLVTLAVMGLVTIYIASKRFRKTLS